MDLSGNETEHRIIDESFITLLQDNGKYEPLRSAHDIQIEIDNAVSEAKENFTLEDIEYDSFDLKGMISEYDIEDMYEMEDIKNYAKENLLTMFSIDELRKILEPENLIICKDSDELDFNKGENR
jgi:hypothetical protein